MDRKKVIRQIEKCINNTSCIECPYEKYLACRHYMLADALALLKDHTQKIIEALENDKIDMSLPDVTGTFTRDREVYNKCCDNHIEMIRNLTI